MLKARLPTALAKRLQFGLKENETRESIEKCGSTLGCSNYATTGLPGEVPVLWLERERENLRVSLIVWIDFVVCKSATMDCTGEALQPCAFIVMGSLQCERLVRVGK